MSLNPEQYLNVARQLNEEASNPSSRDAALNEAKWRSAISRAYYAAFWAGRSYWQEHSPAYALKNTGDDHRLVPDNFWALGADGVLIFKNLITLLDLRHAADYDKTVPNLNRKAGAALTLANRILNAITSLDD